MTLPRPYWASTGLGTVDTIAAVPTQASGGMIDVPVTPVVISAVTQTQ